MIRWQGFEAGIARATDNDYEESAMPASGRPRPVDHLIEGPNFTPGRVNWDADVEVHKLSNNESPIGSSPAAVEAIREHAPSLHIYGDADGLPLAVAIGERFGLDPAQIVVGPGSEQLINWIIQGWADRGDEVLYPEHAFQSYRIRARMCGAVPVAAPETGLRADIQSLLDAVGPRTKVLIVANPNNPTGTHIPLSEVKALREALRPDVLLVVDEAYFEYVNAADYGSAMPLVTAGGENVIVTRTFSKFYGLAGLRVGWAHVPSGLAAPLSRVRGPYPVSSLAMAGAAAALTDFEFQKQAKAHNDKWLPWLASEVEKLGYETSPSEANFVLFRIPGGAEAARALEDALTEKGFIGRTAHQNALPDWIRFSVGPEKAMTGLVEELKAHGG